MTLLKLSIIITSYNIEEYINDCIKDLTHLDEDEVELILVDDCSSDRSLKIAQERLKYRKNTQLISLKSNTIGGVATPANIGIRKARGKYIAFADGDDRYLREMFPEMLHVIERDNTDVVMCDYYVLNQKDNRVSLPADANRWEEYESKKYSLSDIQLRRSLLRFLAPPWRKLYKRDFIIANDILFPEVDFFFEDNPFHWKVMTSAKNISLVKKRMCYHRIAREGQTLSASLEHKMMVFSHYPIIFSQLQKDRKLLLFEQSLINWMRSHIDWLIKICSCEDDYQCLYEALSKNLKLTFIGAILLRWESTKIIRFICTKKKKSSRLSVKLIMDVHRGNNKSFLGRLKRKGYY